MEEKTPTQKWAFIANMPLQESIHRLEVWQNHPSKLNPQSGFTEGSLVLVQPQSILTSATVNLPIILHPVTETKTQVTIFADNYLRRIYHRIFFSIAITTFLGLTLINFDSSGTNQIWAWLLLGIVAGAGWLSNSLLGKAKVIEEKLQTEMELLQKVVFNPDQPDKKLS